MMMMMMMVCSIFFCHLAISSSYLSQPHRIYRSSTVKSTALYTDSSSLSPDNTFNLILPQIADLQYFMDRYHLKTVRRKDHDKKKDMLHLEIYRLTTVCRIKRLLGIHSTSSSSSPDLITWYITLLSIYVISTLPCVHHPCASVVGYYSITSIYMFPHYPTYPLYTTYLLYTTYPNYDIYPHYTTYLLYAVL